MFSFKILFAFALCSIVFCDRRGKRVRRIVGGAPAQLPPPDDPQVHLRFAGKSASVKGVLDQPHYVFRGIRYGEKPTGKDRFQRPRQHFLQGDISATVYPPPCLQPIPDNSKIIGSEDCLFLNIFTPDLPDGTEGLPVVVWIHGGGFRYGSASQYGVNNLVGKRLVVVTIQYRLGTLGFLSTGSPELPGNAGLWDMALAVQWVRNYIGFFGGNPHKIVVMGHGSGASSALIIALSNIAKGTASAVVAMSGTAVSHWAMDNSPDLTAREVADYHGCPTNSILIMLKCLQNLPPDNLVEGDSRIEQVRLTNRGFVSGLNGVLGSAPNAEGRYDGRSLPAAVEMQPLDDMTSGNIPKIPLLTGVTKDETKRAVHGKYRNEIISKLKGIPNFLDQVLVKNLQSFTGLGTLGGGKDGNASKAGLFQVLDPLSFRNYLTIPKNNIGEGLNRIAEVTADALFNLPAFLTVDLWSKRGNPTYLYRFEHSGNAKKGRHFLNGLTVVGNDTEDESNDTVAHGDDLAYLFEARNLDGSPLDIPENLTEEDKKVRDTYTQMIADFAKNGEITVDKKTVPSFSSTSNNFIQIKARPTVEKNFKFCEMALWAGIGERLKSSSCSFLKALDGSLHAVENVFFDTVNLGNGNKAPNVNGQINQAVDSLQPLNVLGIGKRKNNNPMTPPNKSNLVPPLGFLG